MKSKKEIAMSFSGGKLSEIAEHLAENIEWNIYENKMTVTGKKNVVDFGRQVAEYFQSVTTKFEMFGILEENLRIAIYGRAEFIRDGKTINTIHSCDIYEFNADALIVRANSYCNSNPLTEQK